MKTIKNMADRILAGCALILLLPLMILAGVGVLLSDGRPVFYRARRMGKNMTPIMVYKFRTMYTGADREGSITEAEDPRIFPWGELLRKTKVDELPQLINILMGNMSVVGPRPEDIDIVEKYYTAQEKRTLEVLPGLASPGSIFNYTHGEEFLKGENAQKDYVDCFMHIKLSLDLYYLEHWTLFYDVRIMVRTVCAILTCSLTSRRMRYPVEYERVYGHLRKSRDG